MRRLPGVLAVVTLAALAALASTACTNSSQAQDAERTLSLSPGCTMAALTFPPATDPTTAADNVSPPDALDAIWRLDNSSGSFQAFAADAPQASDLTSLNTLDAVFLCVDAPAQISMPFLSPDPSGASSSATLSARCNAVGLSFPDGTTPSKVADAISPSTAFTSIWRLDTESASFQAYAAAAPQASDLASLQFLDAVFVCTTAPASLSMPAVKEVPVGAPPPTPAPATSRAGAAVGSGEPNCPVFPADNPWNTDVSALPVDARSDAYIDAIGRDDGLHPDFGTEYEGAPNGIPFVVVSGSQPPVPVSFDYADESDPGPYPIPPDAPIEGGAQSDGDRHVLVIDDDNCVLYEVFDARPMDGGQSWTAGSGAVFDLSSNDLRPDYWTSADAAGLPIFPGLVRYGEVVDEGVIDHALRFTVEETQRAFIHPATHFASDDTNPNLPPMGLRFRMKAGYDCSGYSQEVQVICAALKKYGMFVADNGGNWFISGAPDMRWSDDNLADIKEITGDALEVVDTGEQIITE